MDDILISRQAVLNAIDAYKYLDGNDAIYRLKQWLNKQECVQSKPGHWIHKVDNSANKIFEYYECSECGRGILKYKTEFCCHCGADMRGDDNANRD